MAADEFFGCILTSFGMPTVLIMFTIILYPLRIITLIISACFWLVSLLLSSVLWFAVIPLRHKLAFGVVFSVLFQELMRLAFIFCLHKIYREIKLFLVEVQNESSANTNGVIVDSNHHASGSDVDKPFVADGSVDVNSPLMTDAAVDDIFNVTMFAYVGGLAFGLISGLFATLNMFADLRGPGTLGYYGQSEDFINLYAAQSLLVIINHTALTVIMSKSYQSRSWPKIVAVVALHMTYSCLTLANDTRSPGPEIVLTVNSVLCLATCLWAFVEAGGQWRMVTWAASLTIRRWIRSARALCQH